MDDRDRPSHEPRPGQRRPRARRRPTSASTTGSGGPTTPAARACPGSASSCSCSAALLLIQQVYPEARSAGSLVVLAVGLAFLIKWAIDRGTGSLYAGAIITALAAPGVLNAAGIDVDGLGTFCFGVAFLFIAVVRARQRRRLGLAAPVRRPARAPRRREHDQPGRSAGSSCRSR